MEDEKARLRTALAEKLSKIDNAGERSSQITREVLQNPYVRKAVEICVYSSFKSEVETREIILGLLGSAKQVYLPVVRDDEIKLIRITGIEELKPGYMGIPEPVYDEKKMGSPRLVEVFILPGLGFTRQGVRLGRGGGHYDRLLSGLAAHKIGLAYKEQLLEHIPMEVHDIPMDEVITA